MFTSNGDVWRMMLEYQTEGRFCAGNKYLQLRYTKYCYNMYAGIEIVCGLMALVPSVLPYGNDRLLYDLEYIMCREGNSGVHALFAAWSQRKEQYMFGLPRIDSDAPLLLFDSLHGIHEVLEMIECKV
jgi:hypothetical protein